MTVAQEVEGAIVATAEFQMGGSSVKVQFLNADLVPSLEYRFAQQSVEAPGLAGGKRAGQLFLNYLAQFDYAVETNGHGDPVTRQLLTRGFSQDGTTRSGALVGDWQAPHRRKGWHEDPDVDVSDDGFWEPVATFGDWDRWFVRDRSGVKLFG